MSHFSSLLCFDNVGRLGAALIGLVVFFTVSCTSAHEHVYVPYSGIISGIDGAEPVELLVTNNTDTTMACTAALAHWYSETLGEIRPHETLSAKLWHDPDTGVINLLNTTNDRMPIEAIWCGVAENMSATRSRLQLPFTIGPAAPRLRRVCASGLKAPLACTTPEG